jgi:PKD repeat protein
MNVEHEYDEPGLYTASLVVTDGSGCRPSTA